MATLVDGLGGEEIGPSGLGTSISPYFTGSITSESIIKGTTLVGTTAVSGVAFAATTVTDARGQLSTVGVGSPTTWGYGIQAGSAIASNAPVAVQFPTAFRAAPISIVVTELISGAQATTAGCVVTGYTAGSFLLLGTSGAPYGWLAVGSL